MFLSNWLVLQIVAAGVTGAVEYPSAADFFMNFDSNNRLYFSGGSKDYVSNLILYKGETEYPVYNGSVSNIYISDPASYVSYIQLCNETYVTNTVDVQSVNTSLTEQKLTASDKAAYDYFGSSVSISGDYAIVGAHGEDPDGILGAGAAYIYVRNTSTGTWFEQQKLTASDAASGDNFGSSVSISGDYAIVGAYAKNSYTGAAYIYTRDASGVWGSEYKITASGAASYDRFGYSVSISGDYAIVGANGNNIYNGAAYIYTRDPTTGLWGSEYKITASDKERFDEFGSSVSISGDYAIVGAPFENNFEGAVYIYTRNGTSWGSEYKIKASDIAQDDTFGKSVSISGDYAIVGTLAKDMYTGAAYIYTRDPSTGQWGSEYKIQASDKATTDWFGSSVSISGDYAIVGADNKSLSTGGASAGAAYIYKRDASGVWGSEQKILASDIASSDSFGSSVSISDTGHIIVGAGNDEDPGEAVSTNKGAAYVYDLAYSYPRLIQDNYNKLSLTNFTPTAGRITFNSNTYEAGTASDFYVSEAGTYEVSAKSTDEYAIVKKTVSDPINEDSTVIVAYDYSQALSTEQKLTASDAEASDNFGYSVSISGDYAIVGAHLEDTIGTNAGTAYIYKRDPSTGQWGSEQKIQASDAEANDYFGWSVSISGDYAIVGARLEDPNNITSAGAAYIYTRDPSSGAWFEQQKLTASDAASGDVFGTSVSISGDYAIVAAIGKDSYTGVAYIYTRDPSTGQWGSEQKITAHDADYSDNFGYSVSISGDYAIVGSRSENSAEGAAYIYTRDPTTGLWGSEYKIRASDAEPSADFGGGGDNFGYSVSISGDYAIVGAREKNTYRGAAYIYKRSGTTWGSEYKITASDAATSDNFGTSVSISGDYAIVGSIYQDPDNIGGAGAAYIYKRSGTTWVSEYKITASDAASGDNFGQSVSISGGYAIVGALNEDPDGISAAGAAYIYEAEPLPPPKLTYDTYNKLTLSNVFTTYSSTLRYDETKTYDIGMASTIIIQDPGRYEIATTNSTTFLSLNSNVVGAVTQSGTYEYDYSQAITTQQKIQASDKQASDQFGESVSISGDYAIVSSRLEDPDGISGAGAAYIYKRDPSTGVWGSEQKIVASDRQQNDAFGCSVSISDAGYAIVGARQEDTGGSNAGAAYIYTRDPSTGIWGSEQKIQASDIASGDYFGHAVSISGDYAIVSSRLEDPDGILSAGSAYIYTRNPSTGVWGSEQKLTASDRAASDQFGESVSISGDYAIVGSRLQDPDGLSGAGAAYIYTRDPSTGVWGSEQKLTASDKVLYDEFGWSVSISSDYAIVGARGNDPDGISSAGAAYIYTRDPSTGVWGSEQKIVASDKAIYHSFGDSVSISGDYAIVGSSGNDPDGISGAGAAYVYTRDPSTGVWGSEQKLTASDKELYDSLGWSVSISDGYAIVGAFGNDPDGISGAGAAYVYTALSSFVADLVPTLGYDGLNTLVVSNVSTGSYNTLLEGSNVLACGTDLTTYPVPKSGITGTFTYSARTKSDSVYAFTNDVSITDYYKLYQYPPIDGTTSGLTTSTVADTFNIWTISGAANGNGTYKAKWSVATGDGTPYNTFRNNVGSTNQVQTALNPTYPIDITLELPSAKTIRKYRMFPLDHVNPNGPGTDATSGTSVDPTLPGNGGADATKRPKSWILYGYDDNPENPGWVSLDTVTDKPISIYGDIYSIDTPGSYQQYKLSVTANNGGDKLLFGDIQLWGDA